jgi:hypothetical protein
VKDWIERFKVYLKGKIVSTVKAIVASTVGARPIVLVVVNITVIRVPNVVGAEISLGVHRHLPG